jgi:ABC-type Na+ transport system ATPase subunit NatA
VDDVIVIDRGRLITRGTMSSLIADDNAGSLEDLFLDLVEKGQTP